MENAQEFYQFKAVIPTHSPDHPCARETSRTFSRPAFARSRQSAAKKLTLPGPRCGILARMINTAYAYFADTVLSPRPHVRRALIGLLLAAGALMITLLIGITGPLIALVLAAAVVGGTLILLDTHWGYVALVGVVFVLPFASLPFRLGFKPTFLDAALGALVFVWALKLVAGGPGFSFSPFARNAKRPQSRTFQISPIGLLIGLFMLMALFSFVYGMSHSRPTTTVIRRFGEILLGIGLFFVVINTVRTHRELEWVTRWLFLAAWACASIAVLFYLMPEAWTVRVLNALARFDYPGGFGALRWIEDDPDGTMRAIGTAVDPNVLGGMMILAAAVVGPQLISPRPLFPRWLTVLFFAAITLALYLTFSRSALFGMIAALSVPAVLKYRRLLPFGIVLGLLLFLLPQTQDYVARLLAGLAGEDVATQMRFGEYKDALILIRRYPLFGVGFSGVPDIDIYLGVSMFYLTLAENMGIIGLLIFVAIMVGFFHMFITAWRAGIAPEREPLLLGFSGAILGALVSGAADHYWFNLTYPHMTVLFWMFMGLAVATILVERDRAAPLRNS